MVVELIAKDKNENLQFEGRCKLKINSISKLLLVEPFNEEFKMISAMFKWKFVAQKNILFVFGEHDFQDFALVFDDTNKCNQVYEILVKKGATDGNTQLIQERFLPSLFVEISKNTVSITKLKEIFVKWIKLFDGNEKEEYVQLLKNYNIYDIFYPMKYGKRRRKYRSQNGNLNFVDSKDKESDSESAPPKKPKLLRNDVSNKKILKPNFQLFCYTKKGIQKKTLIIFCPTNKELCYECYWSIRYQRFFCLGCEKRRFVFAKIFKNANGEEYVKMNKNQHVCDLREFNPSKYLSDIVLEKPLYKIADNYLLRKKMKYLFIFTSSEKKMCYKFTYSNSGRYFYCTKCQIHNFYILAHLCKNENGEEYISIQNKQHICEPAEYCPEKFEIIVQPNFQLYHYTKRGIKKTTLIVFCPTNMKLCYEFYLNKQYQRHICLGCEKIGNVYAEIETNAKGEEYVKQKNHHVCELREFDPTRYQSDFVVQKPFYEIAEDYIYRKEMKYLYIFTSNEKKMCNKFTYSGKYFYCSKCHIQKHVIRAHIFKNENGEEYISIQDKQHICKPIEYSTKKMEYKYVKEDEYQVMKRRFRGKWVQKLYVFISEEKNLCYEFTWHERNQYYVCNPCLNRSKNFVSARIIKKKEDEECLELSWKEHVCKPVKYEPPNSLLVFKPDFEMKQSFIKGAEITYLFVTHPNDKKCYKYTLSKTQNRFICNPCKTVRSVYAKLWKDENGEEYIELGKSEHICQSKKEEPSGSNIINLPNFKVVNNGKDLFIFDENDKSLCYSYIYHPSRKYFVCRKCIAQKRKVSASLQQYQNGQEYLRIGKNNHICKPEKYQPGPINCEYRSKQ